MALIVKDGWLPGFTEPERNPRIECHLTSRKYDDAEGGAAIAYAFHNLMQGEVTLVAGAEGFTHLSKDPRNLIIASCIKANCRSAVWWMIEFEGASRWLLYTGAWNEELGVMVLEAPQYHPLPVVWLSPEVRAMQELLRLERV